MWYILCTLVQFYALAIFFMYRLWPRKGWVSTSGTAVELARKANPLVETQSSSWSVRLYMIFFFFVSSGDGKAIWVRTKTLTVCRAVKAGYHSIIHNYHAWRTGYYPWADICNLLWLRIYNSWLRQCVTLIENKFLENSHVQTLAPHGAMVLRWRGQLCEQARRPPHSFCHTP